MVNLIVPQCAKCADRKCYTGTWEDDKLPEFCPMKHKADVIEAAMGKYDEGETQLYRNSTVTEQRAYQKVRGRVMAVRPRLLEIMKLSEMMGWRRLGVAFCTGLGNEARRVVEILEGAGFEVYSICCKCGAVDKTVWGIDGRDKIVALRGDPDGFEAGCNPIVQAEVLKSENTDLNIIVGLCVGHDIQFTSFSAAPVTTLIVKDRLTGHNPFATLYSGYHHPRLWKEDPVQDGRESP